MDNPIETYNLVCAECAVRPNYDLSSRETYIKLYFTLNRDVIIIGEIDNNYIYWMSITKVDDLEINERIFNHIANEDYRYVTHEYKALKQKGLDCSILRGSYGVRITKEKDERFFWKTPFGHYYGKDQIENNGKFFAEDVSKFIPKLLKKCEIREAGGIYKNVLKQYCTQISAFDCMSYNSEIKPFSDVLENEGYLILSQDREIRELYGECLRLCNQKYNEYMSAVR